MTGGLRDLGLARPPGNPRALGRFPRKTLKPAFRLWRVTRHPQGPWWFSSSLSGRFDLPSPEGTCYLAGDELGALLEVLGGPGRHGGGVSRAFLGARRVRRLSVPRERRMSDLTSRRAIGFGITAEIGTLLPYDLPQKWAAQLRRAGSDGLTYWLRQDPSRSRGFALFDAAGERKRWKRGRGREISRQLVRRLEQECGIAVLDLPRSSQLHFIQHP